MNRPTSCATALLLTLALGCAQPEPIADATAAAGSETKAEIAWYDGDVEAAFAASEKDGKPLFLYWGAVWCPPCHYLKTKIFKQPSFVEASTRFRNVYLDGDTESAQYWGEHFATAGYPTVIIFDAAGNEVIRMSSGIPVDEYTHVLDTALSRMRPVNDVLDTVLTEGAAAVTPEDLTLLAFNSWSQDSRLERPPEALAEAFAELWNATPEELAVERSRFLSLALEYTLEAEAELTEERRTTYHDAVIALVRDRRLRNSNVYFTFYSAGEIVDLLHPEPSPDRDALIEAWTAALIEAEADEELTVTDRLATLYGRIGLARASAPPSDSDEPPPLPAELVSDIEARVAWANETVTTDTELQAVMNTMAGLLSEADLIEEAKALVTARMDETVSPHYYMSWMSSLEEESGDIPAALEWSRRAYDEATGPYTRFQWGSSYVRDVIRLTPDDLSTVERAAQEILTELLVNDDAFANRNYSRLRRLDAAFGEWAESGERQQAAERIRAVVAAECDRYPAAGEDSQNDRCTGFLVG